MSRKGTWECGWFIPVQGMWCLKISFFISSRQNFTILLVTNPHTIRVFLVPCFITLLKVFLIFFSVVAAIYFTKNYLCYLTHNDKFFPFAKNNNYLRLDLIANYQITRGVKFNPQQNNNISNSPSSELSSLLINLSHMFFLVFWFSYTDLKTTGHV